jgi:hypothetical protein
MKNDEKVLMFLGLCNTLVIPFGGGRPALPSRFPVSPSWHPLETKAVRWHLDGTMTHDTAASPRIDLS